MKFLNEYFSPKPYLRSALLVFSLLYIATPSSLTAQPERSFGPAPSFTLTAKDGKTFHSSSIENTLRVVNFFFTSCQGPCPIQTAYLKKIFEKFGTNPKFHIISVTVDPKRDTPEVLSNYARTHAEDAPNWHFLTGDLDAIVEIMNEGFKLGSGSEPIYHSSRFIVVDSNNTIIAYIRGTEAEEISKLENLLEQQLDN